MAISKIIYKSSAEATPETWMDATTATAAAANIIAPYTAMLADGIVTTGTGSGGGGGLTYEAGTYTPVSDIARPTISFTKTHTEPPSIIVFRDETGTDDFTTNANWEFVWLDFSNKPISWSSSITKYGIAHYLYRGTSTTSLSASMGSATYPYSNTGNSSNTYYRYWAIESEFYPSSSSASRYWIAGRTYKWVAIWSPIA